MLRKWLIDYCNDVLNSEIVACQKHKWACKRFLKDIKNEGTKDFPYIFVEEKAQHFLSWMTLFKHTKGKLQGKNIVPDEIQVFNFSNIYGWVHKDSEKRRFKKAYWQVGRKNAKSQSLACVASYESFAFGVNMSEVYIGATKSEQAKIVWKETEAQIKECTFLKGKYKVAYGKIQHLKSNSFIEALSKDANKSGDGFNPQCGIIDEYHAHKTSEIYDVLDSGMGARLEPLMMIITTAGFEIANPCFSVEYKYVSQILDPDNSIQNEEYFVMINELDKGDDIKDEKNWVKANPILCSYEEGIEYIRSQLKIALDVPEKMRNFLTKNMDIWVDMKENGYMPMDKWNDCGEEEFPNLRGEPCYIGIDLSKKIDLTSVTFEFPMKNGDYYVLNHSYLPEDTLEVKRKTDKVPYDLWVKDGWITATNGAVIDYRYIMNYIQKQEKEQGWVIKEICYDPYNASQFAQEMADLGYEMVEIRQGVQTLGEPTKDFREQVFNKKIKHNNNPVLTWTTSNAVTRDDHNGNIMLDKKRSIERIDPIAATINAHVRAMHHYTSMKDMSEYFLNGWSL